MEGWNPETQEKYNECLDKQFYDLYLKVKELPDDIQITFNLKNPEGDLSDEITMSVEAIKDFGRQLEERNRSKTK